jgi:hypothetical protein
MKSNKVDIFVTDYEMKLIEGLIEEHYNKTGIVLSKSHFCRNLLFPVLKEAHNKK